MAIALTTDFECDLLAFDHGVKRSAVIARWQNKKGHNSGRDRAGFLLDQTQGLYWRGETYMEGRYHEFLR
jgi:hypothetical protein